MLMAPGCVPMAPSMTARPCFRSLPTLPVVVCAQVRLDVLVIVRFMPGCLLCTVKVLAPVTVRVAHAVSVSVELASSAATTAAAVVLLAIVIVCAVPVGSVKATDVTAPPTVAVHRSSASSSRLSIVTWDEPGPAASQVIAPRKFGL